MEEKNYFDYFIKDEGDFFTLGLVSEKAKKLFLEQSNKHKLSVYGTDILKVDILNDFKPLLIAWLISHNLRGEEF